MKYQTSKVYYLTLFDFHFQGHFQNLSFVFHGISWKFEDYLAVVDIQGIL